LRHAHASELLRRGVPLRTVSQRLGQANPTVTLNIYAHVMSGDDERAADTAEEMIKKQLEKKGALLFYIFQRISQVVYDPALLPVSKQLWADEVWRFLANNTARQYLVAAGKTWRKHNGGIGLITQSAADLQNAGVLDLVNEICPTKILLADLAAYQRMFHLNEREVELFSALIPKRQFLVKTAHRSKVLNVHLDPNAYWQYTNSPYDNERRRQAIEEHGLEKGLKALAAQAK
jgi:type IV secretion system protein VirB4